MRIRVSFEPRAGVSLWADDAEARARYTSAIPEAQVGLPSALIERGEALRHRLDEAYDPNDPAAGPRWDFEAASRFVADERAWFEEVRDFLAPHGFEVVLASFPTEETPEQPVGQVLAFFATEEARAAATWMLPPQEGEAEWVSWSASALVFASQRPYRPMEWLQEVARQPGFVAGWWWTGEGEEATTVEGAPLEHALQALRERNLTGWLNFLQWIETQGVVVSPSWVATGWSPTVRHRLGRSEGSWWERLSFYYNTRRMLRALPPTEGYRRRERDRLRWCWESASWPKTVEEALAAQGWLLTQAGTWEKGIRRSAEASGA